MYYVSLATSVSSKAFNVIIKFSTQQQKQLIGKEVERVHLQKDIEIYVFGLSASEEEKEEDKRSMS